MARINIENRYDPQMAAALRKQMELAPDLGEMTSGVNPGQMREIYRRDREFWNEDAPEIASVTDIPVSSPAGTVAARVYHPEPDKTLPVLVFSHGGGFMAGDNDTHDKIMRELAKRAGMAVVGVDYHLSPEHKFPTPLEDVEAVLNYLLANSDELKIDCSRLGLGGDSAGAYLSLATCLKIRRTHPGLVKHLQLVYGTFGLRDSVSRRLYGGQEDGCGPEDLKYYFTCFFGDGANRDDPLVNLLQQDMAGLPPTFIIAADIDPVHDDSAALHALMADAGVDVKMKTFRGVLHGFLHYSRMVDQAGEALSDCATQMMKHLGA
ncbi:MAG: alpha/beta hydrolase fold domain-containing protein [Hyphomicrobiales bacterium]